MTSVGGPPGTRQRSYADLYGHVKNGCRFPFKAERFARWQAITPVPGWIPVRFPISTGFAIRLISNPAY